jgi:hypothetical protein
MHAAAALPPDLYESVPKHDKGERQEEMVGNVTEA